MVYILRVHVGLRAAAQAKGLDRGAGLLPNLPGVPCAGADEGVFGLHRRSGLRAV